MRGGIAGVQLADTIRWSALLEFIQHGHAPPPCCCVVWVCFEILHNILFLCCVILMRYSTTMRGKTRLSTPRYLLHFGRIVLRRTQSTDGVNSLGRSMRLHSFPNHSSKRQRLTTTAVHNSSAVGLAHSPLLGWRAGGLEGPKILRLLFVVCFTELNRLSIYDSVFSGTRRSRACCLRCERKQVGR